MKYSIRINQDQNKYKEITQAVKDNDNYCPCLIEKNEDTICMCKDFRDQDREGFCHCERFEKILK